MGLDDNRDNNDSNNDGCNEGYITPGNYHADTKYVVYKKDSITGIPFRTFRTPKEIPDDYGDMIIFTTAGIQTKMFNNYMTWNNNQYIFGRKGFGETDIKLEVYPAVLDIRKGKLDTCHKIVSSGGGKTRKRRKSRRNKRRSRKTHKR